MLEFHDKIINTGKGFSRFAVRFNKRTSDNISIGPYTFSRGMKFYKAWDLSAKSVSESDCVRGTYPDNSSGIFAVDMDMFISHRGGYAKNMYKENDTDLILLEYVDNDVISKSDVEIVLRQCNIVFVSTSQDFITKCNDCTIFDIMRQFVNDKEASPICTFAKPIRNIDEDFSKFLKNYGVNNTRANTLNRIVSGINNMENLKMTRTVTMFGAVISLYLSQVQCLDIPGYLNGLRGSYMANISDDDFSMLMEIFTKEGKEDDLRYVAFTEAAQMMNYLYGKGDVPDLKLKYNKMFFLMVIVPLRKHCKEYARDIVNGII